MKKLFSDIKIYKKYITCYNLKILFIFIRNYMLPVCWILWNQIFTTGVSYTWTLAQYLHFIIGTKIKMNKIIELKWQFLEYQISNQIIYFAF